VSLHRAARLMRASGIHARRKRRFVRTTTTDPQLPIHPNVLARDFRAHLPNRSRQNEGPSDPLQHKESTRGSGRS
jgi:putative transposase